MNKQYGNVTSDLPYNHTMSPLSCCVYLMWKPRITCHFLLKQIFQGVEEQSLAKGSGPGERLGIGSG